MTERVLTLDLGTSAVKAIVWERDGIAAKGRALVATQHPAPGWAEQNADDWLTAVHAALDGLDLTGVVGVGFSSQRETTVCCDDTGAPLRPAIVWSDTRDADWVAREQPGVWARTAWLAYPRDWIVWQLTGAQATDPSIGTFGAHADHPLHAPRTESATIVGSWERLPVVIGGGDRACEVLGTGATSSAPMLSWGTTANVTVPGGLDIAGARRSIGLHGEPLNELGLAGAGNVLAWLAALTGWSVNALTREAAGAPPARAIALPYLAGARAPHWRPDLRAVFAHLDLTSDVGALARAVYEGVAHDVRRCLAGLDAVTALSLAGGGAADPVWRRIVAGVTGLPLLQRVSAEAASAGAALLTAEALGLDWSLEELNRPRATEQPHPALVPVYAEQAPAHDALLAAALAE